MVVIQVLKLFVPRIPKIWYGSEALIQVVKNLTQKVGNISLQRVSLSQPGHLSVLPSSEERNKLPTDYYFIIFFTIFLYSFKENCCITRLWAERTKSDWRFFEKRKCFDNHSEGTRGNSQLFLLVAPCYIVTLVPGRRNLVRKSISGLLKWKLNLPAPHNSPKSSWFRFTRQTTLFKNK